jgi:hypothetical protein
VLPDGREYHSDVTDVHVKLHATDWRTGEARESFDPLEKRSGNAGFAGFAIKLETFVPACLPSVAETRL